MDIRGVDAHIVENPWEAATEADVHIVLCQEWDMAPLGPKQEP